MRRVFRRLLANSSDFFRGTSSAVHLLVLHCRVPSVSLLCEVPPSGSGLRPPCRSCVSLARSSLPPTGRPYGSCSHQLMDALLAPALRISNATVAFRYRDNRGTTEGMNTINAGIVDGKTEDHAGEYSNARHCASASSFRPCHVAVHNPVLLIGAFSPRCERPCIRRNTRDGCCLPCT